MCVCVEQVLYNWTLPVNSERSEQMLETRTFEMISRFIRRSFIHSLTLTKPTLLCLKLTF